MQQRELAVNLHNRMPRLSDIYCMLDEMVRVNRTDGAVVDNHPGALDEAIDLLSSARDLVGRAQALMVRAVVDIGSDCWPYARLDGTTPIQQYPQNVLARSGDTGGEAEGDGDPTHEA